MKNFYCYQIRAWRRYLWNKKELVNEHYRKRKIQSWKLFAKTQDGYDLDLI